MVGKMDLIRVVSCLNLTRVVKPNALDDGLPIEDSVTAVVSSTIQAVKTGSSLIAQDGVRILPGPATSDEASRVQDMLEELLEIARRSGLEGISRLTQLFHRADSLERLERGVELLGAARLLKSPDKVRTASAECAANAARSVDSRGSEGCSQEMVEAKQVDHMTDFEPWSRLIILVNSFGGADDVCQRVEATNIKLFDECLDVLHGAGLTRKSFKPDESGPSVAVIESWKKVVRLLSESGGPDLFLESLQGVAVEDFLRMIGLLRQAGLVRPIDDTDNGDRPPFSYGHGEDAGRIRNAMLHDFVDRVVQAGGFHAFWHALKGVDLAKLKGDLHCLSVIQRKLAELTSEDWWMAVHDAEGLEDLLHSHLPERKRRGDDLTLRQRQRLVKRFKEVGGVESFLEKFDKVNLAQMLRQHEALDKAQIKRVSVIEALAEIGWLVRHEVEHLEGLYTVAETLVRWGDRHYRGENPSRLWRAMHQQVAWLLSAIEENGTLLKATINHGSKNPAKEPELTPARLAQFLQALRPMGGVTGFLAAFRGLDFATAAAQARILHDSCVRSAETTRRLAGIYRLLHWSPSHLRGLEHFLRGFGAPVFAEAQTQGGTAQDRLRVAERWQRLTSYLATAAGRVQGAEAGYSSGPEKALEVLQLGVRLSQVAGVDAASEDWEELCTEMQSQATMPRGLRGALARLKNVQGLPT